MSSDGSHLAGSQPWTADVEYSQTVVANGLIFVSGQYASENDGSVLQGSFRDQAVRTFENLRDVLAVAGAGLADLVFLRCFLLDDADFDVYRDVRRQFLGAPWPGSLVVCTPAFTFPGMLIELEAVARAPA